MIGQMFLLLDRSGYCCRRSLLVSLGGSSLSSSLNFLFIGLELAPKFAPVLKSALPKFLNTHKGLEPETRTWSRQIHKNVYVPNVLATSSTRLPVEPRLLSRSSPRHVFPWSNFSSSTGFIVTPSQFQGKLNIRELPGSSSPLFPPFSPSTSLLFSLPFGFEELRARRRFLQRSS